MYDWVSMPVSQCLAMLYRSVTMVVEDQGKNAWRICIQIQYSLVYLFRTQESTRRSYCVVGLP